MKKEKPGTDSLWVKRLASASKRIGSGLHSSESKTTRSEPINPAGWCGTPEPVVPTPGCYREIPGPTRRRCEKLSGGRSLRGLTPPPSTLLYRQRCFDHRNLVVKSRVIKPYPATRNNKAFLGPNWVRVKSARRLLSAQIRREIDLPMVELELSANRLAMLVHRLRRKTERVGDLLGRPPGPDHIKDVQFTRC